MDSEEARRIEQSWIRLHFAKQGSPEYEVEFWSFEAINELTHKKPSEAMAVILEIAAIDSSDAILGNLGAGPIEDLLLYHEPFIMDRVEAEVRKNPPLRRALKAVWLDPDESPICERLNKIVEHDPPL